MSQNGYEIWNVFYWRRSVTGRLTFSLQLYIKLKWKKAGAQSYSAPEKLLELHVKQKTKKIDFSKFVQCTALFKGFCFIL